ncbi:RAD52 motif-containing protein 1 [Manis javanica]|nr:RAD52 motif-containing protein 1 [Manis javanica]
MSSLYHFVLNVRNPNSLGTDDEDTVAPLQKQSLKFCALDMVSPGREFRSPGVGVAEEPLDKNDLPHVTQQESYFSWKQNVSDFNFEEEELPGLDEHF